MHQHASRTKTKMDARAREGVCSRSLFPRSTVRGIDSSAREESYSFVYYDEDVEFSAVQSGLALATPSVSSFLPRLSLFLFSFRPWILSTLSLSLPLFPTTSPFRPFYRGNVWTGRPIVNVKINSPSRPFRRSSSTRVLHGPRVRKHIHQPSQAVYIEPWKAKEPTDSPSPPAPPPPFVLLQRAVVLYH